MAEPGVPTAADEALAARLILMGLHVDDDMGYAAMDEVFAGGKQTVVNVVQVLAGHALNSASALLGRDGAIAYYTQLVSSKTLEAMDDDKEN